MLQSITSTPFCGEIKMKVVENNEENIAICKQFCGPCPTFKPNGLNTVKPNMLFCARGQSEKPVEEIEDKGCNCFGCPIFRDHELKGAWFCMHGLEGRKQL
jgi:hypothetical protein